MRKYTFLAILFLLSFALFGCGTKVDEGTNSGTGSSDTDPDPGIEGYVIKRDAERILVVDPVAKDFSDTGGLKEFYTAIWVSNIKEDVEIGQKIQVWFKGPILESYPAQAEADKIKILPEYQPEGTILSEQEAIKIALTEKENQIKEFFIPVVKAVDYNKEANTWNIQLKDSESDNLVEVQVEDKRN